MDEWSVMMDLIIWTQIHSPPVFSLLIEAGDGLLLKVKQAAVNLLLILIGPHGCKMFTHYCCVQTTVRVTMCENMRCGIVENYGKKHVIWQANIMNFNALRRG